MKEQTEELTHGKLVEMDTLMVEEEELREQ